MSDADDNPKPAGKKSGDAASSKAEGPAPGSMPLFKDMPPRHIKGARRFVIGGLILAIAIPVGIGLLFYILRSLVVNPQ